MNTIIPESAEVLIALSLATTTFLKDRTLLLPLLCELTHMEIIPM